MMFFCEDVFAVSVNVAGVCLKRQVKSMKEIKGQHVIKQSLDYSCGPAGLATLLSYYLKEPVSEHDILNTLLKTTDINKVKERKGFSLLDLKNYSIQKGYTAVGYKMDLDFLRKLNKPALVPIKFKNYRHFIVIKAILGDRVFAADPTAGNIILKLNYFSKIWQGGVGLVVEDESGHTGGSELDLKLKDAIIVDAKNIKRILDGILIRTTVFPGEF